MQIPAINFLFFFLSPSQFFQQVPETEPCILNKNKNQPHKEEG